MTTYLAQNQFISNSGTPPSTAVPDTAAADQVAPQVAAAEPFHSSCERADAVEPRAADAPADIIGNARSQEALPSNEGRPQEAPASAPTKNSDAGVLDATDCIHEIFHWVRKLMRGHQGFVLDEAEFMADVEEEPLFIREDGYLKRQA